jgi:hypothetical protein
MPQDRKTARPQDRAALFDFDVSGWWTDTWTLFYFRPNPKVSSGLCIATAHDRKTTLLYSTRGRKEIYLLLLELDGRLD